MTEPYIIEMEDFELDLHAAGDDLFLLHHNGGTKAFDKAGLLALRNACMAMLSGMFLRAVTPLTLRLETERNLRGASPSRSEPRPTIPLPKPELDML